MIGLVQVGFQATADRYTYLTQIGLSMAVAWTAAKVAGSSPIRRSCSAAVSALVVAGLMVCAWQQTRYWIDTETLWTRAVACTAQNYFAHNSLGAALVRTAAAPTRPSFNTGRHWKSHRLCAVLFQPRKRAGSPRAGRWSHPPVSEGAGTQTRLRGGALQSRQRVGRLRPARRGHRPFQQGPADPAQLRNGSQQPRLRLRQPRASPRGNCRVSEGPGDRT